MMETSVLHIIKRFAIVPDGGRYRLHIETENGDAVELLASFDQLDQLAEDIDRRLDADQDPSN